MKKKLLSSVLSSLLVFCLILTMIPLMTTEAKAATQYRESEDNNSAQYADSINIATGNSLSGTVSYDNEDWFVFTIAKGSQVKLKFSGLGKDEAIDYSIYPKNGLTEDYYESGRAPKWTKSGYTYESAFYLSAGIYYLELESSDKNVDYKISFTTTAYENVKEPNDSRSNAQTLLLSKTYQAIIADLNIQDCNWKSDDDNDYYKYTTKKAGYYYMTIRNVNTDYLYNNSYDSSGRDRYVFYDSYGYLHSTYCVDIGKSASKLTKLPKGTTYFRIGSFSSGRYTISLTAKPSKVTGVKAKKKGKKSITVKWKAKSGVTGYKIYRSTKKRSGYKLIKTVKGANKKSYVDKKKKKGKRYYYKVVAYKTVNGYSCKGYASKITSVKR